MNRLDTLEQRARLLNPILHAGYGHLRHHYPALCAYAQTVLACRLTGESPPEPPDAVKYERAAIGNGPGAGIRKPRKKVRSA